MVTGAPGAAGTLGGSRSSSAPRRQREHATATTAEGTTVIRDQLATALRDALAAEQVDPLPDTVHLERPARREHGDWSSNVAMASAKRAGRNPRELALALADRLNAAPPPHVTKVEVAGPGFVNFRLADTWLHDVLREVVQAGARDYARSQLGGGRRVNVEFVSANPNKPIHAGHGRGACYGDAVARLLERTGNEVTREFYLNDRGVQMQAYAESLAARKRGEEPPVNGYHGEYVIEWAAEMPDDADPLEWGYERALRSHRATLAALGITFDVWFSERSLVGSGAIDETLEDLRARGVVYEADGAVWLRSSELGDDKDRVLVKSDGEYTYLLPDIAYHRDKFARGFDLLIDVWGADHHGYISRMRAALAALGHDASQFEVVITQLVSLERHGESVAMSGRSGDLIELDDIIAEVGADAVRFTYLLQSVDTAQTVDLDLIKSKVMDNPVFYVQMAHARLRSIARVAAERGVERRPLEDVDLSPLVHERELDVLRALFALPDVVTTAAADRAPHRVTTWLRDTAAAVHGFYHDCYVMGEGVPPELTQARLWLVEAARVGLAVGLGLVGVSAPESM
jgi:arginyl-tRNA synthetase